MTFSEAEVMQTRQSCRLYVLQVAYGIVYSGQRP